MRAEHRLGLATALWAVAHSVLAARPTKALVARAIGERARDGGYRAFYVAQSLVSFGALLLYGARTPRRTLYRVGGPAGVLLRTAQGAAVLHALWAARVVGVGRLSGLSSLAAWVLGRPIPPGAVAQGPEADEHGELTIRGPFLWSRHPLNLSPIPVFWLTPHMTSRRLAFNLIATAYLMLGSGHEEGRLRAAYGARYQRYQSSGVPFFLPHPHLSAGG